MISQDVLGMLTVVLVIVAFTPYVYGTLKGTTRPHLYSWIIWSLIQGTGVWIMLAEGAKWGAAGLFVGTAFCILNAALSVRFGTKDITRTDTIFLIAALVAFGMYAVAHEPYSALALVVFIDLCGFVPSYRKAFNDPQSENISTWGMLGLSNLLSLAALQEVTILTAAYPAALLVVEFCLAAMLLTLRLRPNVSP